MSDDTVKNLLDSLSSEQKAELIQAILSSNNEQQDSPKVEQTNTQSPEQNRDDGLFVMNKGSGQVSKKPVTEGKRFNKFVDDGEEHKDENHLTPSVSLTERKRPAFKKIKQTCTRCNQTFEVHPQFARDFYICDKCLRR
tara:strand:+ start:555 stop:971 length:417 start_codon:yes stop_codon:yes gene_type:complete